MASSVIFLVKMWLGTFMWRCVTRNDTDSWKGPHYFFSLDPTWWLVFSIFGVLFYSKMASIVFFLNKCRLVLSCVAVSRGVTLTHEQVLPPVLVLIRLVAGLQHLWCLVSLTNGLQYLLSWNNVVWYIHVSLSHVEWHRLMERSSRLN